MPALIAIRPFRSADRAFVLDSMRRTLVRNSAYAAGLQPEVINLLVEPILATYQTLVATPHGDDDEILGYLTHDGPSIVGFVYVKEALRQKGIATALLAHAGITKGELVAPLIVTKLPGAGNFPKLCETKGYTVRFRPWMGLSMLSDLLTTKAAA
jgi:GNAT superfamily N-acetyltransferase